ncbi:MAG: hypothetical protein LAN37_16185 [Acidobacteriia bacterium]|jgi:hypothetical protein|nr:hypothetical protein [Terriglobia bacterium]
MDPTPIATELRTDDAQERVSRFAGTLGADLRAIRARRRRTIIELLVTVAGAVLLATLCVRFLMK